LLIFLLLDHSGVLDRFTTCAGRFSKAARLMPWLMKMLDHRTLGASPGTTSVNAFFPQARPAQKREPSVYFDLIYVAGIAE
jgi:hypothetical protein